MSDSKKDKIRRQIIALEDKADIAERAAIDSNKKVLDIQKEILELHKVLNEPDEPAGQWKPEMGDTYYAIVSSGELASDLWGGDRVDRDRLALGDVYRTREEAEQIVKNRKVHVELQELADRAWDYSGEVLDWDKLGQNKYRTCLYFQHPSKLTWSIAGNSIDGCAVYFPTEQSLKAAWDTIGHDRMIAYVKGGLV